jgi:hypothetical protein
MKTGLRITTSTMELSESENPVTAAYKDHDKSSLRPVAARQDAGYPETCITSGRIGNSAWKET